MRFALYFNVSSLKSVKVMPEEVLAEDRL